MKYSQLGSDRDPVGSVFLVEDRILRGIRQEYSKQFEDIFHNPAVQNMLGKRIVETRVAEQGLPDFGLTFEQRRIVPATYCYEWPMQMLQDAALQTLDICIELNQANLILKDGTPWNILFDGPRPVLVDFTSIMPQEEDIIWVAYDQFFRLFLFPLLIGELISGRAARSMLLDNGGGISPEEISRFLPSFTWVRKPWLINRLFLPMFAVNLARKSGQDKNISKYRQSVPKMSSARESFLGALKRDVQSIQFSTGQSRWSQYYKDINAFFDRDHFDAKQRLVAETIEKYKPSSVVDIGCNQGGYSILAALAGARVVAFDTDEDSVTSLYRLAKSKDLNILPLVGNVLYPSPQAGWRGIEFPSAPTRLRSQMALALALVHHLAITQIQTFDRIVQTLADYSEQWLITEFVPLEDPRSQELLITNRRDMSWYTLDAFVEALRKVFKQVDTFPSYPVGRTLCVCQK